ncbi:MAG: hypothetical protein O2854_01770 [Chloroflexi bacterium]|nr:hypothetical protein [Chloroflexota bacterium]
MNGVFAGLYLGLLMASIFISAGAMMLFVYVKNPSPAFANVSAKFTPQKMVMAGVLLAYPFWSIAGVIAGLAYWGISESSPGYWLASPNGAYTAVILILGVMLTLPLALLLRRVLPGVIVLSLAFIGLYGWALPYFAE